MNKQGRLWEDCASVQACLCLIAAHLFDKYQSLLFLLHCYPVLFQYKPEESPPNYLEVRSLHCPTYFVPGCWGWWVLCLLFLLNCYLILFQYRPEESPPSYQEVRSLHCPTYWVPWLLGEPLILAPLLSCFVSVQTRRVSSKLSGSKKSALPYLLGSLAVGAGGYGVYKYRSNGLMKDIQDVVQAEASKIIPSVSAAAPVAPQPSVM